MSASRAKPPNRDELALWRSALKDVKPLPGRRESPAQPPPTKPPSAPETKSASPPPSRRPETPRDLPEIDARRAPGLDKRSAERLKRGQTPIDGRIDLHGMTQEEAHRALGGFITRAWNDGKRCVLVITGKGVRRSGDDEPSFEPGILRSAAPRWLNEAPIRAHILAVSEAQQRHGGAGALYVLLRRKRNAP